MNEIEGNSLEPAAATEDLPDDSTPANAPPQPPADKAQAQPASRSRALMSRRSAALLVIDVQEKLVPHIREHPTVVWNVRRLVDGATMLDVPVLCTEQYPRGLGHTIPLIADRVAIDDEKSLFSCRDCQKVLERLQQDDRDQVLLCGIETHVCVQQTALDLIAMGFDVWVAVDAVGTRYSLDHQTALRRMELAGVTLTTCESALFEWCEDSKAPEFRQISGLVREIPPATVDIPAARYFPNTTPRYVVQTDHATVADSEAVELKYIVRSTDTGAVVQEYTGSVSWNDSAHTEVASRDGVQAVEVSVDGSAINVQYADDHIEMDYLPIGEPRTNHPRWKVRTSERHIASEEYKTDYEITFQVVDYKTDNVYREFTGYEHRHPETGQLTHVSGVRQVEVSGDGRWLLLIEIGRPPEIMELPPEPAVEN
ncbi:MAG: hydrolase [Pirellulaceae bacterium]